MSTGPRPELVAGGAVILPTRAIPWLALFLRLAVGLALMNVGLAAIMASAARPLGGPAGWMLPAGEGLVVIFELLPYAAAAVGVGLVFGIFTTACALAACGLALAFPLLLTLRLLIEGRAGFAPMGRGFGPEAWVVILGLAVFAAPTLVMLVLFSSPQVNRLSMDALIFTPRPAPTFGDPEPGPETSASPDAPLMPDPLAGSGG